MENIREINWYAYNETVLNPIALIFTLCMGMLILILKKKYIIIPILATICYIPYIQRIVIAGLDFDMVRILLIFGIVRIVIRNEYHNIQWNRIDVVLLGWVVITSLSFILLRGTYEAFINRLGFTFNALFFYLLLKICITRLEDMEITFRFLIFLSIFVALSMLNEQLTGRNLFSVFGGVPEYTFVRQGNLRSQGAFSHPILSGTFGAILLPIAWYFFQKKKLTAKRVAWLGLASSLLITFTSASSGPIMTLMACLVGIIAWFFRKEIHIIKNGIFGLVIFLHIIMEGPVWALITRVDLVAGSTAYHRYALLNNAIIRWQEWALLGVQDTAHWGWGLQDVTNMFVRVAVDGGMLSLICFLLIIILSYKQIGRKFKLYADSKTAQMLIWSFGAILFGHMITFFGVSYFGNMIYFYYLLIAIISNIPEKPDSRQLKIPQVS